MKCSANGITNTGNIVLFWPELSPAEFQQRYAEGPGELLEELQAAGKLICFPCEQRRDYSLGLFVDEPVPEELQNYCTLSEKIETLQVGGEGWFGGEETLFNEDSYRDRHPRKCSAVQIPTG